MTGIRTHIQLRQGGDPPALPLFDVLHAIFPGVRYVKFCARTAHSTITEKYDGGAAHTARTIWEAA
jgi:hypothetical protein